MNSLPKTVTRQRRGSDLNPGPTALKSSTLTTRLNGQNVSASFLCLSCPALVLVLIMCASSSSVDLSK